MMRVEDFVVSNDSDEFIDLVVNECLSGFRKEHNDEYKAPAA